MARRVVGISGLVYGISVNVKHTFPRRRKKKNQWGKKIKGEQKHWATIPPVCSQKHVKVPSKPVLWQTNFRCCAGQTDTTSKKFVQLPQGEVKQNTTEISKNKPRRKAIESITLLQFTKSNTSQIRCCYGSELQTGCLYEKTRLPLAGESIPWESHWLCSLDWERTGSLDSDLRSSGLSDTSLPSFDS